MNDVLLTDTTLRDGEQGCSFALSAADKQELAMLLDSAGFYQIEAGIPVMGSDEKDAICRVMEVRKRTKVAVWNRMRREDISHSFDCRPDIIHISAPVSDILIRSVLNQDRAWVKDTLKSCIGYAREKGYAVTVGFQDAARADMEFMAALAGEIVPLGVETIRLADTVGVLTPMAARRLFKVMTEYTDTALGIHAHNDLGMAVAVAAEAVKGGAKYIDTTLFGIGERAGNCDSYRFTENLGLLPVLENLLNMKARAQGILFPTAEKRNGM